MTQIQQILQIVYHREIHFSQALLLLGLWPIYRRKCNRENSKDDSYTKNSPSAVYNPHSFSKNSFVLIAIRHYLLSLKNRYFQFDKKKKNMY